MISKLKLCKDIEISFILRHKWEKRKGKFHNYTFYGNKRLGIFFNKSRCLGKDKNLKECNGKSFIVGLELIYIKLFIIIDYKVLKLEI